MDTNTIVQAFQLALGHQWMPFAVLIVGWLASMFSDVSKFPVSIPDRFKPVLVIVLGQAYAILEAVQGGSAWKTAVAHGLIVSFTTMGLFDLLVKAIFNGKAPAWLAWISLFDQGLVAKKAAGWQLVRPLVGSHVTPVKVTLPVAEVAEEKKA